MTFEELISQTDIDSFYDKTPEERLAFAQEYENLMAELEHRTPCKVMVIPDEFAEESPGVLGFYVEGCIYIKSEYLRSKRPKLISLSQYGFADMLETITHEGRHAWQHYVIEHPNEELLEKEIRLAFQMNFDRGYRKAGNGNLTKEEYYCSYAEYAAQLIELDARHFSIDWIRFLKESFEKKDGIGIRELSVKHSKLKNEEAIKAQLILEYFNADKLHEFEEKLKKELFPGIDTEEITIFADAIDLVESLDKMRFIHSCPVKTTIDVMKEAVDKTKIIEKPDMFIYKADKFIVNKLKTPF